MQAFGQGRNPARPFRSPPEARSVGGGGAMNLSQLYYFRKLAELQHYTNAAKELFITQPALSDAIHSLEKELGVPLFRREGRSVRLTRYGSEFASYVDAALRELDKGVSVMKEYTGRLSGRLSIGGLYTITGDYLPALIGAYEAQFGDGVQFSVSQGFSRDLIKGLKDDVYDVVFSAKDADAAEFGCEPVVSHQLVVSVNAKSPLASRKEISLEDLRGLCVYTYRTGTPIGNEVARVCDRYDVPVRREFDDEITLGGMVSRATRPEVCALVTYTIGLKSFRNLTNIPITEREVPHDFHHVYMMYKKDEFRARVSESFIEFAAGFIPPKGTIPRCGEE